MARYFCHFTRNGVRIDDPRGFPAADHDEATEVAKAIGAIILEKDPGAGDAMLDLHTEGGELIFSSSISALLNDLQ